MSQHEVEKAFQETKLHDKKMEARLLGSWLPAKKPKWLRISPLGCGIILCEAEGEAETEAFGREHSALSPAGCKRSYFLASNVGGGPRSLFLVGRPDNAARRCFVQDVHGVRDAGS